MSPEQLSKLLEISELFEQGKANHEQIRQLSEILSSINRRQSSNDLREDRLIKELTKEY